MDSTLNSHPSGIASWSFWKPFLVGLAIVGFSIVGFAVVFPDPFREPSPIAETDPYIAENMPPRAIPLPAIDPDVPSELAIVEGKLLSEFQLNTTNPPENLSNPTQFSMFRLEEIDGKMIYRIRTLAQGDELIIDAITGKLILIRDSNGNKVNPPGERNRFEGDPQPMARPAI